MAKQMSDAVANETFEVKCEMLGNNRGKHPDGSLNWQNGGYARGTKIKAGELGREIDLDRLVNCGALEPVNRAKPKED